MPKTGQHSARRRSPGRIAAGLLLALIALILVVMMISANTVRLLTTEVAVSGLDEAWDGLKILYVSDLHIGSAGHLRRVEALFDSLRAVRPDVLILGGDVVSSDPIGLLSSRGSSADNNQRQSALMAQFFDDLSDFATTYGKYAVPGDQDNALCANLDLDLDEVADTGGVMLLRNSQVILANDNRRLIVLGLDDWLTGSQSLGTVTEGLKANDTVIVVSHSPEAIPQLMAVSSQNAALGDLFLTGHTLGGQFDLFGHELLNPLGPYSEYKSGWHLTAQGAPMLISQGLNCNWPPLRLGTTGQVHLITLVRAEDS